MRRYIYLLAAAVIAVSSLYAHADTISTFDLNNFVFLSGAVSSGTITIDTTTGVATGLNFNYSSSHGTLSFQEINTQESPDGTYYEVFDVVSDNPVQLLKLLFPGPSLVNYAGGVDCTISSPDLCATVLVYNGVELFDDHATFEDITLVSSTTTGAVPEPASLVLLGTGLLGGVAAIRRKTFTPR